MDQDATDQLATLEFALRALQEQVVVLQDEQMEIVSNCEPWTVRRLASHALNNQLLWAGIVTGEETVSPEETMGAAPYDGDLAQYADDVTGRTLAMWGTDGVLELEPRHPDRASCPGSVVINFAIIDAVCHAWDLAASVGHPIEFDAGDDPDDLRWWSRRRAPTPPASMISSSRWLRSRPTPPIPNASWLPRAGPSPAERSCAVVGAA